uniref:ATP-binding cassette transporter subfamily G-like protein 2 n=1 Tax=Brachionus plicatilis TaxID=10195 RepID=A0A7H9SQP8_BRAPC|nr:ATP-binding cassette transporter subfamily G-like protein 2 [Brachionus plicatilis]
MFKPHSSLKKGDRFRLGNNSGVDDQLDAVTSVSGRSRCSKVNTLLNSIKVTSLKFGMIESSALEDISSSNTNEIKHGVTLTWENLTVVSDKKATFKISNLLRKKEKNCSSKNTIINNVSGIAQSNEILAIMGASGAGKTSLLNALNFRNNQSLNVYGEIKVNGQLIRSQNELSSISGYVQQNDLFIESLTVKETLIFQAMLRMDKSISKEKRFKRIEEVIHDLNLKKCQNFAVDIQGKKGVSGGEKRRLAFACEILTDPLILFCDEPTSGLDSFIALSVIECMKSLAKQGRTIICTIHQPSSEIFELFDRLCLVSDGKLAFNGPINKCNQFFESQGYQVPVNYNPAEFYVKTLAFVPSDKENSLEKLKKICDGYEKSDYYQNLTREIKEVCDNKSFQDRINMNTKNE